ncbi:valine--tRNA ligase [Candidatus Gottesmanbacteria bacterium RBG_16_52_11]|uniref:Valine--tRNA ligase n=1 Tax=Candidatus Gottesmanbacteria bacterium RBG_16_52_11 TaxID=1798374 RepID=A0A1F5YV84_9BACT|nr:MAG: valine--tRNA ligase [Candidatus Gottesmanbacteria bacterium RBG_16_52_11]
MDKTFNPHQHEERIYRMWESGGYLTPQIDISKQPFSIILPLPNANDPMHMGHALFTVQDILARWHRMMGDPTLWLPGGDHAGIETQFVFEKKLTKEGKSRFDFDRETLFRMIAEFVEQNKNVNRDQMKRLGFSLDWTRYHYSLEPEIQKMVLETFIRLHKDGYVYRAERLVNFCTKCGTAFSDLEIKHLERQDPLYYIRYGPFVLATTRPETKFGDTGVAFHPADKRYRKYLGKEIEVMGVNGPFRVTAVADEAIDPEFGTGIEKVTPAHDFLDYEIAKRHGLPFKKAIDFTGRLTSVTGRFAGMKVKAAREAVVAEMQKMNLLERIDENYVHSVAVCYRCGTTIEPMLIPQWYVKTKPLAKAAIDAVKRGSTRIVPLKRFEKMYFEWLENIEDWNISRQIVWGPRIPVWYPVDKNPELEVTFIDKNGAKQNGKISALLENTDKQAFTLSEISQGLQQLRAPLDAEFIVSNTDPGGKYLQETDTFDTWFLSAQWPVNTLKSKPGDFEYFYPTSVLDTLWDILFFWVARMMMLGIYLTGDVPFRTVHIHSRVVDRQGQKMSKSKGNVVNPIEMVDKYGADALRMALIYGAAPGSDIALSEEKIRGMRNFANKLWNIGRFISGSLDQSGISAGDFPFFGDDRKNKLKNPDDKRILSEINKLCAVVTRNLERYRFSDAAQDIYDFTWHRLADEYLEINKERFRDSNPEALPVLLHVFHRILKLLHPFMPFVTEVLWETLPKKYDKPLVLSSWPSGSGKPVKG